MPVVSLAASPPSRETIHKSPAYEKTMFVLLNVGLRISSGLFSCAGAAPASKRMQKRGSNTFFITHSPWDKPALSGVDFTVEHGLIANAMAPRSARSAAAARWVTTGVLLEFNHQILDGTLMVPAPAEPDVCRTRALDRFRVRLV